MDGGGISSTAGSRRRWGDKDNDSDEEFPMVWRLGVVVVGNQNAWQTE